MFSTKICIFDNLYAINAFYWRFYIIKLNTILFTPDSRTNIYFHSSRISIWVQIVLTSWILFLIFEIHLRSFRNSEEQYGFITIVCSYYSLLIYGATSDDFWILKILILLVKTIFLSTHIRFFDEKTASGAFFYRYHLRLSLFIFSVNKHIQV